MMTRNLGFDRQSASEIGGQTKDGLGSWINPHHLNVQLNQHKNHVSSRPLVLDEFLQPHILPRLEKFFTYEALFEKVYKLFSEESYVTEEEWACAKDRDRFFTYDLFVAVGKEYQLSTNWLTYVRLMSMLKTRAWISFLSSFTKTEIDSYAASQLHSYRWNDCLRTHNDAGQNRRFCGVLFLSSLWKPEYGGALHFVDEDGTETSVDPVCNRMLLFDPHDKIHFIRECAARAGDARRVSLVLWYS